MSRIYKKTSITSSSNRPRVPDDSGTFLDDEKLFFIDPYFRCRAHHLGIVFSALVQFGPLAKGLICERLRALSRHTTSVRAPPRSLEGTSPTTGACRADIPDGNQPNQPNSTAVLVALRSSPSSFLCPYNRDTLGSQSFDKAGLRPKNRTHSVMLSQHLENFSRHWPPGTIASRPRLGQRVVVKPGAPSSSSHRDARWESCWV